MQTGIEIRVQGHGRSAFERALRDFNQLVVASGILQEARRRRYFHSPSRIRRQKKVIKREKSLKNGVASRGNGR